MIEQKIINYIRKNHSLYKKILHDTCGCGNCGFMCDYWDSKNARLTPEIKENLTCNVLS